MRILLEIAYHGADFNGWQSQSDGNTIQDHLEKAFAALGFPETRLHGAGRTDAGVHASGQCAHVDVDDGRFTTNTWRDALNAHLPQTIRVMNVRETSADFHARFSATGKIYTYALWNAPASHPLLADRAWHVPWTLDFTAIRDACELFTGTHDFAAFSARRSQEPESTIRTIHRIEPIFEGSKIELRFEGEGFLYKMVRTLAAAVVRHASGRCGLEELQARLCNGSPAFSHSAPAAGLCLEKVLYPMS
ncbi:MAG: tRNA pseudouridine(38-40) synthase TruA [Verrucomicrobiota bacterium]